VQAKSYKRLSRLQRKRKRNNPKNRRCQLSPIALGFITTEPNDLIQPIHNRMPVILRPEDEGQWLDVSRTSFAKAQSLLKPDPEELMDAHDVSPIVNSAKYDSPECIQPVSDDEMPSTGQLSLL
jgi:putative SOS response-associated peptidase YedK